MQSWCCDDDGDGGDSGTIAARRSHRQWVFWVWVTNLRFKCYLQNVLECDQTTYCTLHVSEHALCLSLSRMCVRNAIMKCFSRKSRKKAHDRDMGQEEREQQKTENRREVNRIKTNALAATHFTMQCVPCASFAYTSRISTCNRSPNKYKYFAISFFFISPQNYFPSSDAIH